MKNVIRQEDVKREESNKPGASSAETAMVALKRASLRRTQSNQQQQGILSRLQISLSEHTIEMNRRRLNCARLQEQARNLVERDNTRCIDGDELVLARRLIEGESIETVVFDARKALASDYVQIAASLQFDKEDADVIKALDDERAAVLILKQAVRFQKWNIETLRAKAMTEYLPLLAEARSASIRKFLASLADCEAAAEQDRRLADGLEPEEIRLLRPSPLPKRIVSDDTLKCLLDAVSEKLIEQEELRDLID